MTSISSSSSPPIALAAVVLVAWTSSAPADVPSQTETVKLIPAAGGERDKFGHDLAIDGDTMIVGAPNHNSDAFDPNDFGSVYVFERGGSEWTEQTRLFSSDGEKGDEFGHAVDLDGNRFIAGAPFVLDQAGAFMGSAYLFERGADGRWSEVAHLLPEDVTGGDRLGESVAIAGDTAAAATLDTVYVFVRDDTGAWSEQATLTDPFFVDGVALSGDTLIAAVRLDTGDLGAIVYERNDETWSIDAVIELADAAEVGFGVASVDVDGDRAVFGVVSILTAQDAAFVFERDEQGAWSQQAGFVPAGTANTNLGMSVAIRGGTALVGASHDGPGSSGVFTRDGAGAWTNDLVLVPSDQTSNFGFAVALDGATPVVGAWADHNANGLYAGAVYVYGLDQPCPADVTGDGVVDVADIVEVILSWGPCDGACPADVTTDGTVDVADLVAVVLAWGACG